MPNYACQHILWGEIDANLWSVEVRFPHHFLGATLIHFIMHFSLYVDVRTNSYSLHWYVVPAICSCCSRIKWHPLCSWWLWFQRQLILAVMIPQHSLEYFFLWLYHLNLHIKWKIVIPTDQQRGMIQGKVSGPSSQAWRQKEDPTLLLSWGKPCEPPSLSFCWPCYHQVPKMSTNYLKQYNS